jgi:hypothetical protein
MNLGAIGILAAISLVLWALVHYDIISTLLAVCLSVLVGGVALTQFVSPIGGAMSGLVCLGAVGVIVVVGLLLWALVHYGTISTVLAACLSVFAFVVALTLFASPAMLWQSGQRLPASLVPLIAGLVGLCISGAIIYGVVLATGVLASSISISLLITMLLVIATLALIGKLIGDTHMLKQAPIPVQLAVNTILFIPCLLTILLDVLFPEGRDRGYVALIAVLVGLVLLYCLNVWRVNRQIAHGGQLVVDRPISLEKAHTLGDYQSLNGVQIQSNADNRKYHYGLSFWLYLDALPPSTGKAYNQFVPLLDYCGKPRLTYNASEGKWRAEENDALVYEGFLPMQRWNHIVLNVDGTTLDVFLNGKMVATAVHDVPYMKYDQLVAGSSPGISGKIGTVIYFKEPITADQLVVLGHRQTKTSVWP